MTNPVYVGLTRQSGLLNELNIIATNLANANTTGYRREGLVFSEFVVQSDGPTGSLSIAAARGRFASNDQGALVQTGGRFDVSIEGDGFFLVETQNGPRLTRAGAFTPNAENELVTLEGQRVLDEGGAAIFVPPGEDVSINPSGELSAGDLILGRLAVVRPVEAGALRHEAGALYESPGGFEPAPDASVAQGFIEDSNVDPIEEIARLIQVQRAYEMGQSVLTDEDDRIDRALQVLTRPDT